MNLMFYYKTLTSWMFEKDDKRYSTEEGEKHLSELRNSGITMRRLYLDYAPDFKVIKECFFNHEYWENKTWQEEYSV